MARILRRAALAPALLVLLARAAHADEAPLVHPIFVHMPDAPERDIARERFTAAASHYNLRPVEVVDAPTTPAPKAPDTLRIAIINTQKLAFTEAAHDLDAAAAEVATTGGAALTTAQLSDLYMYRGMATARADWNAKAATPPTDARTKAFEDYLRAATMSPDRVPNARELPPQVVADMQRALEAVRQRPRGMLVVKGPPDALVALDGGALMPLAGGVTFRDLVFGDHLLHVEQVGYAPWGTVVPVGQPSVDLLVPARDALGIDDATAAAHGRRMGARFALVATPKGGPGAPLELTLIDTATNARRDAALVDVTGDGAQLDAAVMRLDEGARKITLEHQADRSAPAAAPVATDAGTAGLGPPLLLTPPPAKARFRDDPAAWARDHWPLLTAIGFVAATAIVMSAVVASDR
jgi:hypothetical protein